MCSLWLRAGAWRCCNGRGSTTARGMKRREAAQGGHLQVLRWAREQGCPWDFTTCLSAAAGGHLEVLRWAREHDCEWDEWTCLEPLWPGTWRC